MPLMEKMRMHLADINDVNRNRNMVNLIIVPLQLKKMVIVTINILHLLVTCKG